MDALIISLSSPQALALAKGKDNQIRILRGISLSSDHGGGCVNEIRNYVDFKSIKMKIRTIDSVKALFNLM